MSKELSGLELRIAAAEAIGEIWKDDEGRWRVEGFNAAAEEHRFTDNEVSGNDLPDSGASNLIEKNGVTNKP